MESVHIGIVCTELEISYNFHNDGNISKTNEDVKEYSKKEYKEGDVVSILIDNINKKIIFLINDES